MTINRPFLGTGDSFEKAYPTLTNAIMKYTESNINGDLKTSVYSAKEDGPTLRCSKCNNEYNMEYEIKSLLLSNETTREISFSCSGWEVKRSKHSNGIECVCSIQGTLELKMKPVVEPVYLSKHTD
jgi:hypothetical protein